MNVSYGPFGRSKVLCNITGGIVVTKDGSQLIEHYLRGNERFIRKYWTQQCVKHAESVGDGLVTTYITLNSVLNHIDNELRLFCKDNHIIHTKRILQLRSTEAIIHTMKANQTLITDQMIRTDFWHRADDIHSWLKHMCHNILVPACDLSSVRSISDFLILWLLPEKGDEVNNSQSMNQVFARCQYILTHIDSLLFSSINGNTIGHSSSSSLHAISSSEMVLLGRCRDFLILTTGKCNVQHQQLEEVQTGSQGSDRGNVDSPPTPTSSCYRFVCIRYLVTSDNNRYDSQTDNRDAPSAPLSHIVTTSAGGDDLSFSEQTGMSTLRAALTHMKQRGVKVVLCSDKVESEAVFEAASHGIHLMDCVSPFYLSHLSERCRCRMYFDSAEWVDHIQRETLTPPIPHDVQLFGGFERLQRLKFSSDGRGGSGSISYFQIVGLKTHRSVTTEVFDVQQVIVQYSSTTQCGTHNRLIRRCLRSILFADGAGTGLGDPSEQMPVMVPGGGAAELGWSLLWRQIALCVQSCSDSASLNQPVAAPSTSLEGQLSHYLVDIAPLVAVLAECIVSRFAHIASADCRRGQLVECARVCQAMSEAYLQAPKRLLSSCAEVIDLPSDPGGNIKSNRRTGRCSMFDNAWLAWLGSIHSASAENGGKRGGATGIVANTDLISFDLCRFGDVREAGICSSHAQFWTGQISSVLITVHC